MNINIYMRGPHPQSTGALVTVSDIDDPVRDGMNRYCKIEVESCDEIIAAANDHYKAWNGTTIELNALMEEQQPVVIRDELLYALRTFRFEYLPFTATYVVHDAHRSPFVTRVERRTLDATAV